ncbi:thiosulfate sulfurtransferase GlpE [Dysgonomonas termitidis]|uniref:Thiosulfate sulfurtransferase GlpE n=1 Tax=Dysgonomonas termitidis TaxID=1516126 RepID=A0ABV9KSU2_9BACT
MPLKRITPHQAKEKLLNPETILVDIRDEESFRQGHVKGATHLTHLSIPGFVSMTNKTYPILVMCYHGNSSQMVAQFLTEQGFEDVYSIDGGYEGWE